MPISLPTAGPGPAPAAATSSPSQPLPSITAGGARSIAEDFKARALRRPHWTWPTASSASTDNPAANSTRAKSASTVVLLRAAANAVHWVWIGLLGRQPLWFLLPVADQLVAAYAVSFLAEAQGERMVLGVTVGERFFDIFLGFLAVAHAMYIAFFIICVVTFVVFFGVTGWSFLALIGLVMLPGAWVASRPEIDGGLTLP